MIRLRVGHSVRAISLALGDAGRNGTGTKNRGTDRTSFCDQLVLECFADRNDTELGHVVGTNRCHLGIAVSGTDVVVLSVIDNLTKGAAGGAIQWMNRLFGFAETSGLDIPGLGWA